MRNIAVFNPDNQLKHEAESVYCDNTTTQTITYLA